MVFRIQEQLYCRVSETAITIQEGKTIQMFRGIQT